MGSIIVIFIVLGIVMGLMICVGKVCDLFVKSNVIGDEIGSDEDFIKQGTEVVHAVMYKNITAFDTSYKNN